MKTPARVFTLAGVLLGAGVLCSFHAGIRTNDRIASVTFEAPSDIPLYREVKVEVRDNGLAYAPGATLPFTGDAVELQDETAQPSIARRTPYLKGRRHGIVTSFTRAGTLREERVYEWGRPLKVTAYHANGHMKYQVALNSNDVAEGRIQRWYDNGVLASESQLDATGRSHGIEKEYDEQGHLAGEYVRDQGGLRQIVFESPDLTLVRQQDALSAEAGPLPAMNINVP
ncbi:MAG: toxin-antitoxin system YwqK family antitoxin [Verrucomicrobium sp.]|nr:hypothetical protein [Verrucomicrobium sp.]